MVSHVWGPFGLALSFNSGFAFSLFSGRPVVVTVLLSVAVVVLAVARGLGCAPCPSPWVAGWSWAVRWATWPSGSSRGHGGEVADFITLDHWPTFNLADACVTVGCRRDPCARWPTRRPPDTTRRHLWHSPPMPRPSGAP